MNSSRFPYIALAVGLFLVPVVIMGRTPNSEGATSLPLLTLLLASEFAFIVTAIGAYLGFRQIRSAGSTLGLKLATVICSLLTVSFLLYGISLWPS